jgi:hypothetical protein
MFPFHLMPNQDNVMFCFDTNYIFSYKYKKQEDHFL